MVAHDKPARSPIRFLGLMIWLLAALFFLYEFFLRTFIGTVAHQVIPDLHLSAEQFAILGSSYYIVYSVMQVPVGVLADKFGVRIILTFATLVCAASTLLFAHVDGFQGALVARILMGFGSSFAFISLLVVAATWFPRRYFAFFAGTSQFIGTLGPLLAGGPLVLLLAQVHNQWRVPLFSIGMVGIVLAILIAFIVRDNPKHGAKRTIFLERITPLNTRLLRLAKNPQAWAIAFYSGCVYVSLAFFGVIWGTEYLQTRGLSQATAASIISMSWIGYAIACPLLGAFSDIAKRRKPTLIGCAVLGVIVTSIIAFIPVPNWVYVILFLGLGFATSGQNVGFAMIAERVDSRTKASALGLNNGMVALFDALLPPIASLFITLPTDGSRVPTPHDFVYGLAFLPCILLVGTFIACFMIKETYCKPQKEHYVLQLAKTQVL